MHPITMAILAAVGVFALFGAYKGARRGISRQVIRSVTVIISLFLSVYLIKLLSNTVTVRLTNLTGEEMLGMLKSANISVEGFESFIKNLDGDTLCRLLSIPFALVIIPVCFIICFLVVKLVLLIPHAILCGMFGFTHRKNNAFTRFLGFLLGAVQGVAIAAVIIAPAAGAVTEFSSVIEEMQVEAPNDSATIKFTQFYNDNVAIVAEDQVVQLVAQYGGRALYSELATISIGDTEYDMVSAVKEPAKEIAVGINHLWGWDWKKPSEANEEAINDMVDAICDSEFTSHLIANLCAYVGHVYDDSNFANEIEQPLADVVDAAFDTISKIDQNSLEADLTVLIDAYLILARENVIYAIEYGNTDEITDALTRTCLDSNGNETTVIKSVITALNNNEHTAPLVTTLAKISVSTMAAQMGMDDNMTQLYEDVRGGLFNTLTISKEDKTEEEYKAEVTTSLDTILKDNGIEIETEIVEGMANYIYENYDSLNMVGIEEGTQLSEQKMNDVIFSYFDAYMEYVNTGEVPDELPGGIEIPDGIEIPGDIEIPGGIEIPGAN